MGVGLILALAALTAALFWLATIIGAKRRAAVAAMERAERRKRWEAAGAHPLRVWLVGEPDSWQRIGESRWWRPMGEPEDGWFELSSDLHLASDEGNIIIVAGTRIWSQRMEAIRRAGRRDLTAPPTASYVTDAELCAAMPFWVLGIRHKPDQGPHRASGALLPLDGEHIVAGTSPEHLWAAA